MNARLLGAVGLSTLLLSCQASRSTSTEVENEVAMALILASAEDTSVLPGTAWSLVDSAGTLLASGVTDSAGIVRGAFRWSPGLRTTRLQLEAAGGGIRSILVLPDDFTPLDTLEGDANLLTESVAQRVEPDFPHGISEEALRALGDSIARAVVGFPLPYGDLATRRDRRTPEANAMLGVLEAQSRRSGLPPRAFVETLRLDPRRDVAMDSGFASDLAEELRHLELSPDSQSLVAWRIDSLGGRDGKLVQEWTGDRFREDSLLFATLLPWTADAASALMRGDLLWRADQIGHDATDPQLDPSRRESLGRTIRRATIRLWVMILGDLDAAPTDTFQRSALDQILYPTRMVMLDSWKRMRPQAWIDRDSAAASFIGTALVRHRSPLWSTRTLVSSPDPRGYATLQWPMPPQKDLPGVLDSLAATGRWGAPVDIVLPKSDSSGP